MTDAPALILVPMEPTGEMLDAANSAALFSVGYARAVSASPFIEGVPVEVVERMARAIANSEGWDNWDTAQHCGDTMHGNDPDDERNGYRDMARAALRAAGIKVADNG